MLKNTTNIKCLKKIYVFDSCLKLLHRLGTWLQNDEDLEFGFEVLLNV